MIKKLFIYISIISVFFIACEEVYVPNLDSVDNFLVVDGRLNANREVNYIYLHESLNFNNESSIYPPVTNAKVILVSDAGGIFDCIETAPGTYKINQSLENNIGYHLEMEVDGEIYESGIQVVPELPHLDSVYGELSPNVYVNEHNEVVSDAGFRIYTDISQQGDLKNYRFFGRKVLQYVHYIDTLVPGEMMPTQMAVYNWRSYTPQGIFNIAAPPEYSTSTNIIKHPLEFFIRDYNTLLLDTQYFGGWIYIIDQFGISEDSYSYYSDLNKQLDAEGKLFDPVYIQAEGNIKCISKPEIEVLGKFEIASHKEHRYFLKYLKDDENLYLREIPYFYEIPNSGVVINDQPDFWEFKNKKYPIGNE